jgi:hypothetical protein
MRSEFIVGNYCMKKPLSNEECLTLGYVTNLKVANLKGQIKLAFN